MNDDTFWSSGAPPAKRKRFSLTGASREQNLEASKPSDVRIRVGGALRSVFPSLPMRITTITHSSGLIARQLKSPSARKMTKSPSSSMKTLSAAVQSSSAMP